MNRWATRHRDALEAGLEPGEQLLDADRVLRAKPLRLSRPPLPPRPAAPRPGTPAGQRRRRGADPLAPDPRLARSLPVPLPVPRGVFVLGLTDRRLVFWRATRALATPVEVAGSCPVTKVSAITATRPFLTNRLVVIFDDGSQLALRPSASRNLRHLATAFDDARGAT